MLVIPEKEFRKKKNKIRVQELLHKLHTTTLGMTR